MLLHWFRTAWRSLISNPLFSAITIASLSIGCCGALLAGSVIKQHLSFDRWTPHADRIAVIRYSNNGREPEDALILGLRPAIEGRITGVRAITRVAPFGDTFDADFDGLKPGVLTVDPDYFKVFDLPFLEGDPAIALIDPGNIVISRRLADKLVGPGPAIGKTIKGADKGAGAKTYRISGVIRDVPPATHWHFDAIMPFGSDGRPERLWSWFTVLRPGGVYVRMEGEIDQAQFLATANHQIGEIMTAGFNAEFARQKPPTPPRTYKVTLVPLTSIHLGGHTGRGIMTTAEAGILTVLASAAAALLAVSSFNFITMSLARNLRRRREVAVRKIVGAGGGSLAVHYLAESALVTAISLAIGFGLAELLHPWFARTIGQPETLFRLYDPVFLTLSLAVFALLALAIGAYPAFYLSVVRPRVGLEETNAASPTLIGRIVSGGLLGFQVFAATVLLIFSITMGLQAQHVAARPLGFSMKDIQLVDFSCPTHIGPNGTESDPSCPRHGMEIIRKLPGVIETGVLSSALSTGAYRPQPVSRAKGSSAIGETDAIGAGPGALETLQANLLAGRFFDANSAYDAPIDGNQNPAKPMGRAIAPVIVTRAMLPLINAPTTEAAIGQHIYQEDLGAESLEIVGVVEDWHRRSLRNPVTPVIFYPGNPTSAVIRIAESDVPRAEQAMQEIWKKEMYGVNSYLQWSSAYSEFELLYQNDTRLMTGVTSFASVAVIVAGLGVFGLSALDMRRRVREIGIRKALGASAGKVAAMVLGRQLQFAAAASILAWPVGYWLSGQWLAGYVYRTDKAWIAPLLATAIILAFVALAVGLNTVRAAAIRPSSALRTA
jgi:putative ABC transport system permease protein